MHTSAAAGLNNVGSAGPFTAFTFVSTSTRADAAAGTKSWRVVLVKAAGPLLDGNAVMVTVAGVVASTCGGSCEGTTRGVCGDLRACVEVDVFALFMRPAAIARTASKSDMSLLVAMLLSGEEYVEESKRLSLQGACGGRCKECLYLCSGEIYVGGRKLR